MGDTIPRQHSLGCIRKLTAHEPTVEPGSAIPPGPMIQFVLWLPLMMGFHLAFVS